MKLYEVQVKPRLPGSGWSYTYHTTVKDAKQVFNKANKRLIDTPVVILANKIELRTDLSVKDWISLLEGDAPGSEVPMTPQDLILSRETIKETVRE